MAKIELRHLDIVNEKTYITAKIFYASVTAVEQDFIGISLFDNKGVEHQIDLDKSTAIRFAKTLRTEINKIQ